MAAKKEKEPEKKSEQPAEKLFNDTKNGPIFKDEKPITPEDVRDLMGVSGAIELYHRDGAKVEIRMSAGTKEVLAFNIDEMIFFLKGRGYTIAPPKPPEPIESLSPAQSQAIRQAFGEVEVVGKKDEIPTTDRIELEARALIAKAKAIKEANELIALWKTFLELDPSLDQMNEMTHDLIARSPEVMKRVWGSVLSDWSKRTDCKWDKSAGRWIAPKFDPKEPGEDIHW